MGKERERGAAMMLIRRLSSPAASTSYSSSSSSSSSSASFAGACAASKRRSAFLFLSSSTRGASASADLDSDSAESKFKPLVCVCETTRSTGLFRRRRRRRRRSRVSPRAKAESKELKEIDDRDWESETAPGLFTRLVITLCLGLAAVSGGGLLIRLTASIFAIFLACVRYVFISVALIFILSLLWEEGAGMQRKEEKASVDK